MEVETYVASQMRLGGKGEPDGAELSRLLCQIFAREDGDRNGSIDIAEFTGPKQDHDEL